jgi:TonB family protein
MNEIFIFLIKAAIINGIILAFFYFTLRKSNKFQLMRVTLLTAMILPPILPLIPYPLDVQQNSSTLPVITLTLPETSLTTAQTDSGILNIIELPVIFYYGVSFVLFIGMFISIFSIFQKKLRSHKHFTSFGKVELEHTVKSPFSFFSWVFLSPEDLSHPQLDMILKHEFSHVKEKHSIDRIISGIFRSILWFSPFAHITSRLLSEIHEYQADSKVIGVYDKSEYSDLILSFYLSPYPSTISNNFSLHTKKRISMINNLNIKRLRIGRILLGLSLSISMVLLTSMVTTSDQKTDNSINIMKISDQISDTIPPYPDITPWILDKNKTDFTGQHGKVIVGLVIEPDGTAKDIKIVKSAGELIDVWALNKIKQVKKWYPAMVNGKAIRYQLYYPIEITRDETLQLKGSLAFNPDTIKKSQQDLDFRGKMPDSPPEFPGGDLARYKYMSEKIIYPADAIKEGIEGKVYIKFIIDERGKVINPKVIKGVHPSLDKVALDVVSSMPDWKPGMKSGKSIDSEMTLPISFNLEVYNHFKDTAKKSQGVQVYSKSTPIAPQKKEGSRVYTIVEETPEFPGGDKARSAYFRGMIEYSEEAKKQGIEGTVYVTFVIEADGSITEAKVLRGIGGGLDEVALKAVENMPKWNPGKVKGDPVPVQFNMPIKFTLQEDKKSE